MAQPVLTRPYVRSNTYTSVMYWEKPERPAPPRTLLAIGIAGLAGAIAVPDTTSGIGYLILAVVCAAAAWMVMGRPKAATFAWGALSLALIGVTPFRDAEWLFYLCLLGALAAASLAVAGGRSPTGIFLGSITVTFASVISLPWVMRGLKALCGAKTGTRKVRYGKPVLLSIGLLVVFVPLLASADPAFAKLLSSITPTMDGGFAFRGVLLFALVAIGMSGACLVITSAPDLPDDPRPPSRLSIMEWAMPVGILVLLFTAFAAVQFTALFGGVDYVLRTADITSANYARGGFLQLIVVTVLTLGVVAAAARWAPRHTSTERTWLRGLLGALSLLVLVIVASALSRMWAYQQAYGFTVLRLSVEVFELWLGLVYVLVIVAGVRLEARWLPRAVVGSCLAGLFLFAVLNPERVVAEHNVARYEQTGKIDVPYLSTLSTDAVPVLMRLPVDQRQCAMRGASKRLDDRSWQSWNLSRATALPRVTTGYPARCQPHY
nr:Permease of the drug/metabolite transporter (DMT) superfamily [Kibdelosporangium sp. MJ126-NF4]